MSGPFYSDFSNRTTSYDAIVVPIKNVFVLIYS